jgi:hypothetical protein
MRAVASRDNPIRFARIASEWELIEGDCEFMTLNRANDAFADRSTHWSHERLSAWSSACHTRLDLHSEVSH